MPAKPIKHVSKQLPTEIKRHGNLSKIRVHAKMRWVKQLRDLELDKEKGNISQEHYELERKHLIDYFKRFLDDL